MSVSLFDLKDKVALITGSSQGLGLAMARGLAGAGATIILNGRNEEKLQGAVTQLQEEGFTVHGYSFDTTQVPQVEHCIRAIEVNVGSIDILVNNAGIQRRAPLESFNLTDWQEVMDINLTGVFVVAQQVARGMITRKEGKIINIASLTSEVARPTVAPYTAAKGGVKMLTKAMATEWAKHNIQVNGIGPGYFVTEMNKPLVEDAAFNSWICARTPAGRWGDPSELAGAAIFLASRASDFINGQILYVDGGVLASL
jgi:gluconate 5-dehydrogenase